MANRCRKRCSTSLIVGKVDIETTVRYHLAPVRTAIISRSTNPWQAWNLGLHPVIVIIPGSWGCSTLNGDMHEMSFTEDFPRQPKSKDLTLFNPREKGIKWRHCVSLPFPGPVRVHHFHAAFHSSGGASRNSCDAGFFFVWTPRISSLFKNS